MTTLDESALEQSGCPVAHAETFNVPFAPAGWHMEHFGELREQSPIYTGLAGGFQFFLATRMDDIRKAYQNADVFSNSAVELSNPNPPYRWIPEMLDGKYHLYWRQLLGPLWTPAAVEKMRPKLIQRFAEVLDTVAAQGECEFVQDVALLFPNVIFMDLMGLPRADAAQFQQWEVAILHGHQGAFADQQRMDAMMAVIGYFTELIKERRADPRDDMLSFVLAARPDGVPLPDQDILEFCLLMFMAGLDTVASQLTYNFWHLATHPQDRERLVADPGLIPGAIEELLRFYSFVTPSRKVMADTEIAGCPVKAGQMVHLPLVSANRDPREFGADAGEVVIDRQGNRHIAFGAGPHRCLGSNLARAELTIAMTMWHERIPNYRIADGADVQEHGGQVGISALPLVWDR